MIGLLPASAVNVAPTGSSAIMATTAASTIGTGPASAARAASAWCRQAGRPPGQSQASRVTPVSTTAPRTAIARTRGPGGTARTSATP
ncbi:hypothetical protein, partial [Micromonospora parastrephiae]|uniref:hypothetical protein n=1 Tax=Micromonospora parastrephiae TaxID=2806101 RepID=UPI001EE4A61C